MARAEQAKSPRQRKSANGQSTRSKGDNSKPSDGQHPYQPNAEEQAAIDRYLEARKALPPNVQVVASSEGKAETSYNHPWPPLGAVLNMELLGITDENFFHGLISQLRNAGTTQDKPSELRINFMLSVIRGIAPKDQVEIMLAAQMAVIQMATMTIGGEFLRSDLLLVLNSYERVLNKLARTFSAQMEALKRYRTSGQQKVTVEHVTGSSTDRRSSATRRQAVEPQRQSSQLRPNLQTNRA